MIFRRIEPSTTSRPRFGLLSTTLLGGAAALMSSSSAFALCTASGAPGDVTVTCSGAVVTDGSTNSVNNANTISSIQSFNANLIGNVQAGANVSGFGLSLVTTAADGSINFTNNGTLTTANGFAPLQLTGNGGNVSYTGTGALTGAGSNSPGIQILNNVVGTGAVSFNSVGGSITTFGTTFGIAVNTTTTGGLSYTTSGGHTMTFNGVNGQVTGINLANSATTGDTTINSGTAMTVAAGGTGPVFAFTINHQGTGNVSLTQNAAINLSGTASTGVLGSVVHAGATGNVTWNQNASFTGGTGGAQGINIEFQAAATGIASFTLSNNSTITTTNYAVQIGKNFVAPAATHQVNVTAGSSIFAGTTGAASAVGILSTAQSLNLTNGGTISSILGNAIDVSAGFLTGTNTGTITGVIGVNAGLAGSNFVNASSITGTGGTALSFTGAGNTLELRSGFSFTGNVSGGVGANTLRLGGTVNSSFNSALIGGQFTNFATLDKAGTSTWTLTGTSTYTGNTTVNGGTLAVNGSIATSALTAVNTGGTLAGIGTVGATQVNAGGIFAPGSGVPGSSMTVSSSLTLAASAVYMVQINPTTSSLANVTTTATLGGATVNAVFAPGAYIAKQYTILTAGTRAGTFNAAVTNTNLPSGFASSLSYDATHAYLDLALNLNPGGGGGAGFGSGLNGNQQKVANALTNFFNTNGGIPAVFGSLTPTGLTVVSGETATGSQQVTFDAMTQFMGVMTDPFTAGRGGDGGPAGPGATGFAEESNHASAYAANGQPRSKSERDAYAAIYRKAPVVADPYLPRWAVWAAGFGGSQTTDGNAVVGSSSTTSRLAAGAVGADYRFSPYTVAGFALAGGGTSFSLANGLGSGRSDLFQAGAFIRHTVGPAYITAALAYGWQDVTTDRTVIIAGVDQLRAKFNANAYSGRLEGGYRIATPWMGVTPYAAGQFTTFDLPTYAERAIVGANTFALAFGSKSVTASRSELGIRTDKSWAMADSIFTLRGRFAWAHDYNTDRSIGATFQTLPGASFVVNGAAQSPDKALTTGSAEIKWRNGFSLAGTFEGEFSSNSRSYAGKGVARYEW